MNEEQIDLGEQPDKLAESAPPVPQEPSYPTVMLLGDKRLMNIPDQGFTKFKHKVVARHMPHGHQKSHRIEMQLESIHKARAPKAKKRDFEAEDKNRMHKAMEDVD